VRISRHRKKADDDFFEKKLFINPDRNLSTKVEPGVKAEFHGQEEKEEENVLAICQKYRLTGAPIINILQCCPINCLDNNPKRINSDDLLEAIRRESIKGN
jgi:hypothetical protein